MNEPPLYTPQPPPHQDHQHLPPSSPFHSKPRLQHSNSNTNSNTPRYSHHNPNPNNNYHHDPLPPMKLRHKSSYHDNNYPSLGTPQLKYTPNNSRYANNNNNQNINKFDLNYGQQQYGVQNGRNYEINDYQQQKKIIKKAIQKKNTIYDHIGGYQNQGKYQSPNINQNNNNNQGNNGITNLNRFNLNGNRGNGHTHGNQNGMGNSNTLNKKRKMKQDKYDLKDQSPHNTTSFLIENQQNSNPFDSSENCDSSQLESNGKQRKPKNKENYGSMIDQMLENLFDTNITRKLSAEEHQEVDNIQQLMDSNQLIVEQTVNAINGHHHHNNHSNSSSKHESNSNIPNNPTHKKSDDSIQEENSDKNNKPIQQQQSDTDNQYKNNKEQDNKSQLNYQFLIDQIKENKIQYTQDKLIHLLMEIQQDVNQKQNIIKDQQNQLDSKKQIIEDLKSQIHQIEAKKSQQNQSKEQKNDSNSEIELEQNPQ